MITGSQYFWKRLITLICCTGVTSCAQFSHDGNTTSKKEERVAQIAVNLATLREEHEQLRPSMIRMAQVSDGIDNILRQIEGILGEYAETLANQTKTNEPMPSASISEPNNPSPATPAEPSIPDAPSSASSEPSILPTMVITDTPQIEKLEPTNMQSTTGGKFYLHIASYLSQNTANQQWQEYQRRNLPTLGDLALRISKVTLRGKELFRVTGGPITDRNDAYERCRKLAEVKIYCKVTAE